MDRFGIGLVWPSYRIHLSQPSIVHYESAKTTSFVILLYSKCHTHTHGYCHCGEECQWPLTALAAQSVKAEDVATCELFLVFDVLADTLA